MSTDYPARRRGRPRLLLAVVLALVGVCSYYAQREYNPITGETQSIAMTLPALR